MSLRSHLPAGVRRRAGRVKRALLDQPEPMSPSVRRALRRARRRARKAEAIAGRAPVRETPTATTTAEVTRLELRRRSVLAATPENPSILEIGPAHNGILPRRDGYDTKNVDYLDRAGLVHKYQDFEAYSMDDIEEVDFVLAPGAAMAEAIDERFDLVLASHVLEHTTSLVDFLQECAKLLAPDGTIALVVPDHRFCFDRFRPRSSIGRIIDAHLAPPSVHSVGTLTEFTLNAVRHGGVTAWDPVKPGGYRFAHTLDETVANAERARTSVDYIDVHNWIFSPNHLRLILQDLNELGYLDLKESAFHETVGHEFFINLSPTGPGTGLTRHELLLLADAEQRTLDAPAFEAGAR